ncbi:uncharacterized protein LOC117552876 [Gymnodraco acuticeps]|uniref:Uncharacterized protein LOC117552876 n=1 Tax=Gymnodraco acuticeps TaxID=8218 RepID=A0A6P8UX10_GYMAC|nr:uncharacterized protein LOC117552876 [Gymnodraco acuticeps]
MNMLGTLEPHLKPRWHEHLDAMTHAYNCTQHDSTGYTPYYLMFGRHPRLPVDLIFGLSTASEPRGYSDYVQIMYGSLSQAYAQTNQTSRHAKAQQKKHYDRKAKGQVFIPGDRVLVKVCQVEGRQKLGDRWEARPYIVVKKQLNTPAYVIRLEDSERERVVHRNLLTQCMFLPVERASEVIGEEVESDAAEDCEIDHIEEVEENVGPGTPVVHDEPKQMEEVDVDEGQMDEGDEESTTVSDTKSPDKAPRRNPPRNRCALKRQSCESQVLSSEEDQRRRERGWKLWQRAKASREAGQG